jgi:hypothetical protein
VKIDRRSVVVLRTSPDCGAAEGMTDDEVRKLKGYYGSMREQKRQLDTGCGPPLIPRDGARAHWMTRIAATIFVLGIAAGCESVVGVFVGEARLRPLSVSVAISDGDVVITASRSFVGITCDIFDIERDRRLTPSMIRTIWRASCPHGDACMRSVRYGDPSLRVEMPAEPLTASSPGECYYCNVGGPNGRGDTKFRLTGTGQLESCPGRSSG